MASEIAKTERTIWRPSACHGILFALYFDSELVDEFECLFTQRVECFLTCDCRICILKPPEDGFLVEFQCCFQFQVECGLAWQCVELVGERYSNEAIQPTRGRLILPSGILKDTSASSIAMACESAERRVANRRNRSRYSLRNEGGMRPFSSSN